MISRVLRCKAPRVLPVVCTFLFAIGLMLALGAGLSHANATGNATGWEPTASPPSVPGGRVNNLVARREFSGTAYLPVDTFYASVGAFDDGGAAKIYRGAGQPITWHAVLTSTDKFDALDVAGDNIYAGGYNSIYKSSNDGLTWTRVFTSDYAGLRYHFFALAINPMQPNIVYAAGLEWDGNINYPVVLRTTDGGKNWTRVLATPKPAPYSGTNFDTLAINPLTPTIVYVGGGETVLDSYDQRSAIYRTGDGGDTWTPVFSESVERIAPISTLIVDPYAPGNILAGTRDWDAIRILRSADDGLHWSQVFTGAGTGFAVIAPAHVYALSSNTHLYESIDSGAHWQDTNHAIGDGWWSGYSPMIALANTLYAGVRENGIWKSIDAGEHWASASDGLMSPYAITQIAVVPDNPAELFLGAVALGWKTTDAGQTWTQPTGVGDADWKPDMNFAVNPASPDIVYAGITSCHTGNLFRSDDGGIHFAPVYTAPVTIGCKGQNYIRAISVAASLSSTVYAVGQDEIYADNSHYGLIVRSQSGGLSDTWTQVFTSTNADFWVVGVDPVNPTIAYVGGRVCSESDCTGVLYRTQNAGTNWTQVLAVDAPLASLAIDPQKPKVLYATTTGSRLYKSIDGGDSWTIIRRPQWEEGGGPSGSIVAIDPRVPSHAFLGGGNGYIGESTDGGVTWSDFDAPINQGFPDFRPSALVVATTASTQTLYAGFSAILWRNVRPAPRAGLPVTITLTSDVITTTTNSAVTFSALVVDNDGNWVVDGTDVAFSSPGYITATTAPVKSGWATVRLPLLKQGQAIIHVTSGTASAALGIVVGQNHAFLPALAR